LAESGLVRKSKIGRRTAEVFLYRFCTALWNFNNCKQKRNALEKRNGNCYVFADSCWAIGLVCYWLTVSFPRYFSQPANRNICPLVCIWVIWAFPSGFTIPIENCPELSSNLWAFPAAFLYPFSSAQWLSNSLYKHFPVVFGENWAISCPFSLKQRVYKCML
jgi:hypothetical protein